MNEKDLRDCFAMFAMMGLMASNTDWEASDPWRIAEKVLEARDKEPEQEVGIVAAKTRRKK
jgi:predicted NAD-dependent protein-ADP-ribosyltransferase YbiA (DUF1768 family)